MKRVLVTGNLGYLGPIVVDRLKNRMECYVVGLDTGWFLPTMNLRDTQYLPNKQIFGDLRDPLLNLPNDIDTVIHLAGLSNDPISEIDPTLTQRINVMATIRMINNYPDAHHVVASSASVYGATAPDVLSKETDEVNPLTAYAEAKAKVDKYLLDYGDYDDKLSWTSLRFGTLWGWSPNMRRDIVLNAFCWQAAKTHEIAPASNARRPMLHVDDAASVIVNAAILRMNGVFNVASENVMVSDIAEAVARVTESSLVPCPDSSVDRRDYWMDTLKIADAMPDYEWTTISNTQQINKVYEAARSLGQDYPTRIQRVKEVIECEGTL
jgi:nucleoside-diphosphate-sugar epimerase